jgi:hypothetical protein
VSAEYAALIRRWGTDEIPVSRIYVTALTLIRALVRGEGLTPDARLDEIRSVIDGLERVQEELDAREI